MFRVLVTTGLLGRASWLVANGIEAAVGSVERWADDPPPAVLTPGRPPFFYALAGPPTVVATVGATVLGPRRPAQVVSAVSTAAALGVTATLVRTVVLPLRRGAVDRDAAVARWYRRNRLRMLLEAVAVAADVRVLVRP
ncbi:hypothetical protein [Actinomycetospora soli]|uniref:hypothetical protein n=1 Tax=Actinomycetospora soli TaxID=2893887 RepID=UPI001E2DDB33|nr:hypothetical protein [Actinomycetospora soli]MCD2187589.1 hypothetical protein [Actinomycetospora soli]